MAQLSTTPAVSLPSARARGWLAVGLIVGAVLLAYANSFSGPFLFDDPTSISGNPTIRQLWPIGPVLTPPVGAGVGGRPVANLTLAVNHALGGENVWGYHAGNILIHALAALALYGLVRRTLLQPVLRERFGAAATWLALAVAGVWALHPVQTIDVDYISQRTESLMGLFYLLTLYGFARSAEANAARWWQLLTVVACALGMASKEVMVTAPVMAFLYDRTFIAGSFSVAWRARWKLHLGLAATWVLLGFLMKGLETRGVGFGLKLAWWSYAAGGCYAICTYLRLAVWPFPLVFDYGPNVVDGVAVWPYAVAVVGLAGLTIFALWRRPLAGFLAAWFLVILAPTSSVVPIVRQMVAENRMYVPLAAVVAALVLGAYALAGRRALVGAVVVALGFGALTHLRNDDYRDAVGLWKDTLVRRPENWRAHNILADMLAGAGRTEEAMAHYQASLRIDPTWAETHNNLGALLEKVGRTNEAIAEYETALKIEAWRADMHTNLGNALGRVGRVDEGRAQLEEALRLNPNLPEAHNGLANLLLQSGRGAEAVQEYEQAQRLSPESPGANNNLGLALMRLGRTEEAISQFERWLRVQPNSAAAHANLAQALSAAGRTAEAVGHYETALRLDPSQAEAANNLGVILVQAGRTGEARPYFEAALRAKPDYADAGNNLAIVLVGLGQRQEARQRLEAAVRANPGFVAGRINLAGILWDDGLTAEAREQYEAVLKLKPDSVEAREGLARVRAGEAGKR